MGILPAAGSAQGDGGDVVLERKTAVSAEAIIYTAITIVVIFGTARPLEVFIQDRLIHAYIGAHIARAADFVGRALADEIAVAGKIYADESVLWCGCGRTGGSWPDGDGG